MIPDKIMFQRVSKRIFFQKNKKKNGKSLAYLKSILFRGVLF